ncbi:MAG: hypothetical protein QNK92_10105 [Amylibacter sp.]
MTTTEDQTHSFDGVEQVVADSFRFRRKLGIGADASPRVTKNLQQLWDIGGVAASGAAVAASSTVAGIFFASSGWMATLGFGAVATTPIGWVIGAAVASGGPYYGVTRLFQNYGDSRVETIPTFINTPIDLLGAALFNLLGAFAVKVAIIYGHIHDTELATIQNHFVTKGGSIQPMPIKLFK